MRFFASIVVDGADPPRPVLCTRVSVGTPVHYQNLPTPPQSEFRDKNQINFKTLLQRGFECVLI